MTKPPARRGKPQPVPAWQAPLPQGSARFAAGLPTAAELVVARAVPTGGHHRAEPPVAA